MSADTQIYCACCHTEGPADKARYDSDLTAHVCTECQYDLRYAQAVLATPYSPAGRIAIAGCYKAPDAPDNFQAATL